MIENIISPLSVNCERNINEEINKSKIIDVVFLDRKIITAARTNKNKRKDSSGISKLKEKCS